MQKEQLLKIKSELLGAFMFHFRSFQNKDKCNAYISFIFGKINKWSNRIDMYVNCATFNEEESKAQMEVQITYVCIGGFQDKWII